MVTYAFYRDVYKGYRLEGEDFDRMILRAETWMQKLERDFHVIPRNKNSRSMAVCAVADIMDKYLCIMEMEQATVGKVSVRYEKNKDLRYHLMEIVSLYMDFRRGLFW